MTSDQSTKDFLATTPQWVSYESRDDMWKAKAGGIRMTVRVALIASCLVCPHCEVKTKYCHESKADLKDLNEIPEWCYLPVHEPEESSHE